MDVCNDETDKLASKFKSMHIVQNKAFPCVFTAISLSYSASITCFFSSVKSKDRHRHTIFMLKYIYIYMYISFLLFFKRIKIQVGSIQYGGCGGISRAEWKSVHDFTGCYRGDELQWDLCVSQDVLGIAGSLLDVGEDERGPASRGNDTV